MFWAANRTYLGVQRCMPAPLICVTEHPCCHLVTSCLQCLARFFMRWKSQQGIASYKFAWCYVSFFTGHGCAWLFQGWVGTVSPSTAWPLPLGSARHWSRGRTADRRHTISNDLSWQPGTRPPIGSVGQDRNCLYSSWVINLDSVTVLWLVRFDDWFDLFGPF